MSLAFITKIIFRVIVSIYLLLSRIQVLYSLLLFKASPKFPFNLFTFPEVVTDSKFAYNRGVWSMVCLKSTPGNY